MGVALGVHSSVTTLEWIGDDTRPEVAAIGAGHAANGTVDVTLPKIWIDGVSHPVGSATIALSDPGVLLGNGVFEVVRLYGGRFFALDDHLARLQRSAAGLRLAVDLDGLRRDARTIEAGATELDAAMRLVVMRSGKRIAILEAVATVPDSVALAIVEYIPNPLLCGLKTLSYAANALANRVAREQGADQALLVTPEGRVLEGPNSAFFVGFGAAQSLVTPPLTDGILDSITRRRLLSLVDVVERPVTVDELDTAVEAFVASTLREVLPVIRIGDRLLAGAQGRRTRAAAAALRAHVHAHTARDRSAPR